MIPDGPIYRDTQRIYYEHTDAAGVVYHANHLKLYERARTEWMRSAGFDQQTITDRFGIVFAVYNVEIKYLMPAMLDDLLHVDIVATHRKRTSVRFEQAITRGQHVLSTANIVVVCVRNVGGVPKSVQIPEALADKMPNPQP